MIFFMKCVIIMSLTLFQNFVNAPGIKNRTKQSAPQLRTQIEKNKLLRCDPNYKEYDFNACQDAMAHISDGYDDAEGGDPAGEEYSQDKTETQYEDNPGDGSGAVTTEDNEYEEDGNEEIAVHQDTMDVSVVDCSPDTFECYDANKEVVAYCIPMSKTCDGIEDCKYNKEDEINCENCRKKDFKCRNGTCLRFHHRCNQVKDCEEEEDEYGCNYCPDSSNFRCFYETQLNLSSMCLESSKRCDGHRDCRQGEDEIDCESCTEDEDFMCETGGSFDCIRGWQKCDGVPDCLNEEDESNCDETESDEPTTEETEYSIHNKTTKAASKAPSKVTMKKTNVTTKATTKATTNSMTNMTPNAKIVVSGHRTYHTPSTVIVWENTLSPTNQEPPPDVANCYENANCRYPFGYPSTNETDYL